jgi:serine/threonine-protein kinase HipA
MMSEVRYLDVELHGEIVGQLRYEDERVEFRFSNDYMDSSSRSVLGQLFEDDLRRTHSVRSGVPAWFANLLPEGPLRELLSRKLGIGATRSFFLLAGVGSDLPGAVRVIPRSLLDAEDPISEDEGQSTPEEYDSEFDFKFSLAGVQLKFSVIGEQRGLTIPVHGAAGDFIVKLPDQRYEGVPENEWTMMTWAGLSGLDVPEVRLIPLEDVDGIPPELVRPGDKGFLIRRFDRTEANDRIHTEDFAQVLNHFPDFHGKYGGANYETIARILLALEGIEDVKELVKRIVMMVAMGNGDAHLKNFSLIYPDRRRARLAPAYDLVSTAPYAKGTETLALNLAKSKRFDDVDLESFRRMARKIGLREEAFDDVVVETVQSAHRAWRDIRPEAPAAPAVLAGIDQRLKTIPLMQL